MAQIPQWSKRGLVAGGLLFFLLLGGIAWQVSRVIHQTTEEVRSEQEIAFSIRSLPASPETDFEAISAPAVFFQAAEFQGRLYVAGPAGLSEFDLSGAPLRQYVAGREFPSSPLVAMATVVLADSHEPELLMATAQSGILAFNGRVNVLSSVTGSQQDHIGGIIHKI